MDPLAAKALSQLNLNEYKSDAPIYKMLPIGILKVLPKVLPVIEKAKNNPQKTHERVQQEFLDFRKIAREMVAKDIPLPELGMNLIYQMFLNVFIKTVPLSK
jgi:hypothetical protein